VRLKEKRFAGDATCTGKPYSCETRIEAAKYLSHCLYLAFLFEDGPRIAYQATAVMLGCWA
jgi:hypothetical protein